MDEFAGTNSRVMRIVSYQDNQVITKPTPLRRVEDSNIRETLHAVTLRDQVAAQYKIQDLKAAQDADLSVNSLKKLLQNPKMKLIRLPVTLKESVLGYSKKRIGQLFVNPQGILCVRRTREEALRFSNDFMIVMPQLYHAEILYRAHNENAHRGVNKVVAQIQQRHDWIGLQQYVNKWINSCLECQQRKNPVGKLRFHLQNIVSEKFNDVVQFDHVKICKTHSGNTALLVMIDHYTKYAEAVPCSAEEMDAKSTAGKLLAKWFAQHGTPAFMQSDNATNFTAELQNAFMRASQTTQVHSTAHHAATNGLVERQNRTLLNMLRVFATRRMRYWDHHIDEVLGAYNSTRHASTGFSPYMLLTGHEKSIPLSYIYPEFAADTWESHEAYVRGTIKRQQEIHELVRRNMHQAQVRQKKYFDRRVKGKHSLREIKFGCSAM